LGSILPNIKTMKKNVIILVFILLGSFNPHHACSQNWQWKWADKTATTHQSDITIYPMHCDFHNSTYSLTGYESEIYFEDTAFFHGPSTYNSALIKHDSAGNFCPPLDLWVGPSQNIFNPRLVADQNLNIYVGGSFAQGFNIQDTSFTFAPGNSSFHPEVFIVKLDADYDIKWGKLISGTWQDDMTGMIVNSSDEIILSTHHICSPQYPTTVIYLNQDTASYPTPFSSVLKINLDGEIQWRKEIRGYTHQMQLTQGENDLIYFTGYSGDSLVIDNDTVLYFPWGPNHMWANFIIAFDQEGQLVECKYLNPHLRFYHFQVDADGNKYLSTGISDTLIIANDTIVPPEDEYWKYVAKFNPSLDEALWYHIIPEKENQSVYTFRILLHDERVLFFTTANKNLIIGHNIIPLGLKKRGVYGEFGDNGELLNLTSVGSQFQFSVFNSLVDNCGNIVTGGSFNGQAIFGADTLKSYLNANMDAFVAKLQVVEPTELNLGNDSTVCEAYTLYAPAGYFTYIWNDSVTNQNWLNITETGGYVLQCSTEDGCWMRDSIYIDVNLGIDITLPNDTLVCIDDSISFTVDASYQSYLWSTGDTTNSINILAGNFGPGQHWISLEINEGPCFFTDSISVTVHPEIDVYLPNDTLVCSDDLLYFSVPDNYEAYYWSTGETTNSISIDAGELGTGQSWIGLEIMDGPCSFSDSISISVHPQIEVVLPNDTLVRIYDTLAIAVPETYEHYQWSTGDTTNAIRVLAKELGVGSHWIKLEITDGPCFFADSISVYVQSDYGINDPQNQLISIVPNPANDFINITSQHHIEEVQIYDIYGRLLKEILFNKNTNNEYIIDISHFSGSLLVLRVTLPFGSITKKIIKN